MIGKLRNWPQKSTASLTRSTRRRSTTTVCSHFKKFFIGANFFEYDARGQIILTCRCILESEGNEGAFAEPFVSAVHGVCRKQSFADRGLDLVAAFDHIPLHEIVKTMRGLDLFKESSIRHYLSMIVQNKVRKILFPPQPEPPPKPSKQERIAADKRAAAAAKNKTASGKWISAASWRRCGTPYRTTRRSAGLFASSSGSIIPSRSPR
jgi:hypothetical protein